MITGSLALLERSLRVDARSWTPHLARLALVGAIYADLCFALSTQTWFGAAGLRFFSGLAYLDLMFMTLLGIAFFSSSITEEREEDTLGLMLMAGISPIGILAGKSGGRLWQALLLVAAQYPFMLLAITMGGVTHRQISSVMLGLLAYMALLGGLGLLCSVVASRTRTAGAGMVASLISYLLIPWMTQAWLTGMATRSVRIAGLTHPVTGLSGMIATMLEVVGDSCVFLQMGQILTTGFGDPIISVQVISNTIGGVICAAAAWLLFHFNSRNPATESASRGFVSRRTGRLKFPAGRSRINPFIWKDFHFVAGGGAMMLVRIIYYGGLLAVAHLLPGFMFMDGEGRFFFLASFSVAIDAGLVLARSIHDEVQGQTVSSLMMLPRSHVGTIYAKFAGALIGWIPGPLFGLAIAVNSDQGSKNVLELIANEHQGWTLIELFLLIPHFAVALAGYLRWGIVPLAVALTFGVYFLIILVLRLSGFTPDRDDLFTIINVIMLAIFVACHWITVRRFRILAAR